RSSSNGTPLALNGCTLRELAAKQWSWDSASESLITPGRRAISLPLPRARRGLSMVPRRAQLDIGFDAPLLRRSRRSPVPGIRQPQERDGYRGAPVVVDTRSSGSTSAYPSPPLPQPEET